MYASLCEASSKYQVFIAASLKSSLKSLRASRKSSLKSFRSSLKSLPTLSCLPCLGHSFTNLCDANLRNFDPPSAYDLLWWSVTLWWTKLTQYHHSENFAFSKYTQLFVLQLWAWRSEGHMKRLRNWNMHTNKSLAERSVVQTLFLPRELC